MQRNYIDGCAYHMVHLDNLQKVFSRGAVLSHERVLQENISYRSIAHDNVQNLRHRISIWDYSERRFRPLHSYVPFYFATHTPMLYFQYRSDLQKELAIFEVSRSLLHQQGALFTDGNASNQQLSANGHETVEIIPMTAKRECYRQYRPGGPYGGNSNRSDFYADVAFLQNLNWDIIDSRWFYADERKRIKHAELLIPDIVPLSRIQGIAVYTYEMVKIVNDLLYKYDLTDRIPQATYRPELFF